MDASVVGARHASALARAAETAWPRGKVIALEPLAGDASARRYVRVRLAGDAPASAIAMLLPHDEPATKSEEITTGEAPSELPFVDVHRYLARHGVPVMAIYHVDERDGVLLLEDLGDLPLADAACDGGPYERDRRALFEQAVDVLASISALVRAPDPRCIAFRNRYDRELIGLELDVVCSHGFAPSDAGPARAADADPELRAALARLGDRIAAQPIVLMHRDFHAWNLHVDAQGAIRVIDFQDALLGPALYDLASLCTDRDSDRFVDPELEAILVRRFGAELARRGGVLDADALHADYFDAVAYRTLRVIGRFRFLAIERGKTGYLRFLPRMARQTVRALEARGDRDLLRVLAARSELFA
ncbi:MAG TPA: phosphotransferase [Candidatus Binatia bacterium]